MGVKANESSMHSLVEEHFVFTNAIQVWSDEIKNHCMYSMLVSLTEYICNATRGAHVAYRYSTILVLVHRDPSPA